MDFAHQLGRRLRRIRKDRGITQAELALAANVGPNYIPRVERGELVPSIETAFRLARVLGVSLDELGGRASHQGEELKQALLKLQPADIAALRRIVEALEAVNGPVRTGRKRKGSRE